MQDIGMSPDYRSGVSDTAECQRCGEVGRAEFVETCPECGRVVCPDCCRVYFGRLVCLDCDD